MNDSKKKIKKNDQKTRYLEIITGNSPGIEMFRKKETDMVAE